jgi:hypothetical protein
MGSQLSLVVQVASPANQEAVVPALSRDVPLMVRWLAEGKRDHVQDRGLHALGPGSG